MKTNTETKSKGGRPVDYFTRCVVMEVQLLRTCSERTAQRRLNKWNWQYEKLLPEHPTLCLNDWGKLTEFEKGRYYGILEGMIVDMKASRGLK